MYDIPSEDYRNDAYYVCYTINKGTATQLRTCACAKMFDTDPEPHQFAPDSVGLEITATYIPDGDKVFVNADWEGKTDIECYAQWIDVSGNICGEEKYNIPDGGRTIPTPSQNGFYILRVVTDGGSRSFKMMINK
jgi:hypothetical protein